MAAVAGRQKQLQCTGDTRTKHGDKTQGCITLRAWVRQYSDSTAARALGTGEQRGKKRGEGEKGRAVGGRQVGEDPPGLCHEAATGGWLQEPSGSPSAQGSRCAEKGLSQGEGK